MVPPSNQDDVSREEELRIRQKVLTGLELALDDVLLDGQSDSRRPITKTEQEKLLYFAIRDKNLSLTYSWYLAGAKTAYDSTEPETPTTPQQPPAPDSTEFGEPQPDNTHSDPEVEEYREYFRTTTFFDNYDLKKLFYTDKTEYLCDFYEAEADEKYTKLYIHSTELRELLENLDETIDRGSASSSLSNWGAGSESGLLSPNKEEEIRRKVSSIHLELAQLDGFDVTRTPVTRGTDVIENVLTKLTHLSAIDEEQEELVNGLGDFFYDYVWKYPALRISVETVDGPNASLRKRKHQMRFGVFDEVLQDRINTITEEHEKAGLEPTIEEFGTYEQPEVMAQFHGLTKGVIDPTK